MFGWFKKTEIQKTSDELMKEALKELDDITKALIESNNKAIEAFEKGTVK